MRCTICDYDDNGTGSLYRLSVIDKSGHVPRQVYYNKHLNEEICNVCDSTISAATKQGK